jgi:hypothetical protein
MSYYFKAFDKVEIPRPIQQRSRSQKSQKLCPKRSRECGCYRTAQCLAFGEIALENNYLPG